MTNILQNVNLYETSRFSLASAGLGNMERMSPPASPCTYVIGDLHGNAMKLFAFLLHTGLIDSNSNTDYIISCIQLYYYNIQSSYSLNEERFPFIKTTAIVPFNAPPDYFLFLQTIQKLQFNAQAVGKIKLIFIGDTLCDRGHSDYMTLLLYDLMAKNKINFTIIASNHDLAFIRQMELNTIGGYNPATPEGDYSSSYLNKIKVIEVGTHASFDIDQITENMQRHALRIYKDVYKPRLKIVAYDQVDDKTIVYSHAPCDFAAIQSLNVIQGVDLITQIDAINHNINPLIQYYCNRPFNIYKHSLFDSPLARFVWNAGTEKHFDNTNHINVFGHLGEENVTFKKQQINLDTNLGKDDRTGSSLGALKVLHIFSGQAATPHTPIMAELQPKPMITAISQAVTKYMAWFSCRNSINIFNPHGDNGQRRAKEVLRRASLEPNINSIKKVLRDFAENQITKDERGGIGGSVQANPHSFISFLLNELKTNDLLWMQLFSSNQRLQLIITRNKTNFAQDNRIVNFGIVSEHDIDFTKDNRIANVIRTKMLNILKC